MPTEPIDSMNHDPQCGELARYFLGDQVDTLFGKDNVDDFADAIQDAVERWLNGHACPTCGSQERDHRGLLKCQCPCSAKDRGESSAKDRRREWN